MRMDRLVPTTVNETVAANRFAVSINGDGDC